ncbi:flagellar motor switch protein FliN [bacterium]|nr:flagellar motor switch protein FliN [bacterium]
MAEAQTQETSTKPSPPPSGSETDSPSSGEESKETAIEFINDVALEIAVELGRTDLPIQKLLSLKRGSVIEIDKLSEEPLDVRVNGKLVARGEAVIVNEMFGIRVTQIVAPEGEEVF